MKLCKSNSESRRQQGGEECAPAPSKERVCIPSSPRDTPSHQGQLNHTTQQPLPQAQRIMGHPRGKKCQTLKNIVFTKMFIHLGFSPPPPLFSSFLKKQACLHYENSSPTIAQKLLSQLFATPGWTQGQTTRQGAAQAGCTGVPTNSESQVCLMGSSATFQSSPAAANSRK